FLIHYETEAKSSESGMKIELRSHNKEVGSIVDAVPFGRFL
ncbi:hypothetical protein NPIL_13101, partial [Nephila pilipes]